MIDPEFRQRIEEVCELALDCEPSERPAVVAAACGANEALRQGVEALLAHAPTAESFLMEPIEAVAAHTLQATAVSLVGRQFGAYTILADLGTGGTSQVYRARDTRLGRDVAIKILRVDFTLGHDHKRSFLREAQAIASLNHPHICTLHDVGEQDGINYLVMECLEGQTLEQRLLENAPLSLDESLTIARQIAEALIEAHRHGVVHRDVKPANILLTKVGAKLSDFGLAERFELVTPHPGDLLSSPRVVFGTPRYMSPEQALGTQVGPRSDVFSLGVVIYEMVTGRRPFDAASVSETIEAVLHKQQEAVSMLSPDTPPQLAQLVTKCLEKDAERRYQSVEEVWAELTDFGRGSEAPVSIQSRAIRRHNLPLQLTSFIGREREVAELCSELSKTRLLTLSGSGGCGKTRLGAKVASQVIDHYADGVWLAELAPVSDQELLPQCVASALRIEAEEGRPLEQLLVEYCEAKQLLLVLDNCEHLFAAVAQFVETILTSCEGVHILATSREPLRIAGERVWRVPSLSVPDSTSIPLAQVFEHAAVRLFVERAQCVAPFQLDQQNVDHVVEICRRLDGIPLALEMAAARLEALSVDQIAHRLNDRFALLGAPHRTSLPRYQTLRHTIDWSYDLLSPQEQTLFRRLAVFVGGFTMEAVERVCSDTDLRSDQMLEMLSRLLDKSMVTVTRTSLGVRYHLLETLRKYVLKKGQEGADEHRIRHQHAEFFLAFAEQLESEFESGRSTVLVEDRAEQEHQNLLAALAWCNSAPRGSQSALRLASALRPFWDVRCYLQLAKQLLTHALAQDVPPSRTIVRLKALEAAAYFLFRCDEFDAARGALEESLQLADELGEQGHVADALLSLGSLATWQTVDRQTGKITDRQSQAEPLQRRSLEISRRNVAIRRRHVALIQFMGRWH